MKSRYLSFILLFIIPAVIASGQVNTNSVIVENGLNDLSASGGSKIYNGTAIPEFSTKEAVKGSRYLFEDWVKGIIVMQNGGVVKNTDLLYNYDKISNALLATADKKIIIELNKGNIQSFTLQNNNQQQQFERINIIDSEFFFQVIVKDTQRYSLYKMTYTKFEKADYKTDGIFEQGQKYDRFTDTYEYYIVMPGNKTFQKITDLKKKSIKAALGNESAKVNAYFSQHKIDAVNEYFLTELINALNQ